MLSCMGVKCKSEAVIINANLFYMEIKCLECGSTWGLYREDHPVLFKDETYLEMVKPDLELVQSILR